MATDTEFFSAAADPMPDVAPAKVLLVDNSRENLTALAALLNQPAVELFSAESPAAALELMLQHDFALAIIGVEMSEVSGFQLAERMRSTECMCHVPIVFVTAAGVESRSIYQGYQSGAIDFLHKPLDSHAVRSKVKVFVDLYQHRAALHRQVLALEAAHHEQKLLLEKLRQTQTELQQAMRLRDQFMSVVSHELRTPLNTMKLELYARRTYLESNDMSAFTPDKLHEMVETDERQLNRLVRLINDITDVSRIRTNQLSMRATPVDLGSLVKRVLQQFDSQIRLAYCTANLQISGDTVAAVDEFRVEQAFINLLTNALRHCDRKAIDVGVEEVGDNVRITVRDYGYGIQPEDHERIFHLFERGTRERKGSGLGLGLFIANQIITAHGGRVTVESRPNEGALFAFILPKQSVLADRGDSA